jgi:IS5 family transposase
MNQLGLFDEQHRLEVLSRLGDQLERLDGSIDWGQFLPIIKRALSKEALGPGGRPAYPYRLMFKILVLQRLYNISDDQTEYQINDRMTFMRFLGLGLNDRVPDAKTIWLFREKLTQSGVAAKLFSLFEKQLSAQGLITRRGSIIDASFVEVPRQRNTREENRQLKEGVIPEDWEKPENANKLRQKDVDARWTKKGSETHYGYKNEPKVDAGSKLITAYAVVPASVHDSVKFADLVDPAKDKVIYGDSAFAGEELTARVRGEAEKKGRNIRLKILEKGYRGKPLTERQKASNKKKSRVRCRVEHVFGFMVNSMKGMYLRSIGLKRAEFNIGLSNLVYNMCRYEFLCRPA